MHIETHTYFLWKTTISFLGVFLKDILSSFSKIILWTAELSNIENNTFLPWNSKKIQRRNPKMMSLIYVFWQNVSHLCWCYYYIVFNRNFFYCFISLGEWRVEFRCCSKLRKRILMLQIVTCILSTFVIHLKCIKVIVNLLICDILSKADMAADVGIQWLY
jgi:uncharacterized protein with PQ loop repeat